MNPMVKIKRVYEKPIKADGVRILVDRLWPRGLSRKDAKVDLWLKDIAPSDTIRKWFAHDLKRWSEFKKKYLQELRKNKTGVDELRSAVKGKTATLLFAAKDEEHNNAVVLQSFLGKKL